MLVFVLLFSVVGCSNTEPAEESGEENASEEATVQEASANEGDTLVVWTFTDELKGIIEDYYVANNDLDYEVDVVVVPNENYQAKLDPALGSGKSAPDVFAVEAGYAKKYVDSDFTKDLTEIGINPEEIDTMEYVMEVATSPEAS